MKLEKLALENFRNLKRPEITPCENINIIYGKNAQGKTNLIESIWMLTGARSFRAAKDRELINFGEETAKVTGVFSSKNLKREIIVNIEKNGRRKASFCGVDEGFATNIIGNFRVIIFSPVHLHMVKGGPDLRRKLIDAAVCQIKPPFAKQLAGYYHVLKQRNTLLKSLAETPSLEDTLEVWNSKLASFGSKVIFERFEYLKRFKKEVSEIYGEISQNEEKLSIKYCASIKLNEESSLSEIFAAFENKLNANQKSDISNGFTSVGPHRDDIDFFLNSKPLKFFGSQGQQRSGVLAAKLAEARCMEEKTGEKPVVLLDDVMSELDEHRRKYITEKIKNYQVFITSCEEAGLIKNKSAKRFFMENGKVAEK